MYYAMRIMQIIIKLKITKGYKRKINIIKGINDAIHLAPSVSFVLLAMGYI